MVGSCCIGRSRLNGHATKGGACDENTIDGSWRFVGERAGGRTNKASFQQHSQVCAKFDPYLPKECRGKNPGEIAEVPMRPFTYCAQAAWVNSDKDLNRVYQKVRLFLRSKGKYDQDNCFVENQQADGKCPTYEEVLVQSQRAWIVLRDANSQLGGYADEDGGEIAVMDFYYTREEETADRIKWLSNLLETYQKPIPNGC